MKNFLVQAILLLCILLVSGFDPSDPQLHQSPDIIASSENFQGVAHTGTAKDPNKFDLLKRSAASCGVEIKIEAPELREEEEEREWSSSRKNRESNYYLDRFYLALLQGYFSKTYQEFFSNAEHSSGLSSFRRHLKLQVFRI